MNPDFPASCRLAWGWWSLFAVLSLVAYLRPLDGDIWYQLLAGRYVFEHGAVPHQDFFVYTAEGAPQFFSSWGFGVLAEGAARLTGLASLSAWNALAWTATLALGLAAAWRSVRNDAALSGPALTPAAMAAFAVTLLIVGQGFVTRSTMRAEVTLYVSWMLVLLVFEAPPYPAQIRRALICFVATCVVLTWLHTTALLLFLVLAAQALRRWLARAAHPIGRAEWVWWFGAAAAAVLLPGLNPNGYEQLFMQLLEWNGVQAAAPFATLSVSEYLPLLARDANGEWLAAALLGGATLLWFARAGARRWPEFLMIAPTVLMTLQHRRGIGLWAMALMVPLARSLTAWLARRFGDGEARALRAAGFGGLVVFCVAQMYSGFWGVGVLAQRVGFDILPRAALTYLPQGGRIWLPADVGPALSYLMGTRYEIPVSGHMTWRTEATVRHYEHVLLGAADWEQQLAHHQVRLLGTFSVNASATGLVPLALRATASEHWQLIGIDRQLLVFAQRPPLQPLASDERRLQWSRFAQHALQLAQAGALQAPGPKAYRLGQRLAALKEELARQQASNAQIDWDAFGRTWSAQLAEFLPAAP